MAAAGVDERADDRLRRAAGGQAALELGLPGVERGAARRADGAPARAVDDLVGGAHVAVERVRRRPDLGRQPARGPVVRRVVAPLHAPARLVGAGRAPDPSRVAVILSEDAMDGLLDAHPALRDGQGRRRQDDRRGRARARGRRARAAHDRLRGRRAGPRLARLRRARACGARPRSSSPRTCGRSRSTRTRRSRSGSGASSAAPALRADHRLARVPALRRRRAGRARS